MAEAAQISRRRAAQINLILGYGRYTVGIFNQLVLVPVYLRFISIAAYGSWLASGNVVTLLSVLDIGFNFCIGATGAVWLWGAARFLIVNAPASSDIIVVIADQNNGGRIRKAIGFFQQGYGKQILLDEDTDLRVYGFVRAQLAEEFVAHISGTAAGKVHVCPILGDSTVEEAAHVDKCVSQYAAHSVLLVTSDYHTRRALATFKRILPRYRWSVAASEDSAEFGKNWWEHREWAKRTVTEWSKFIWWEAVDQWRVAPK